MTAAIVGVAMGQVRDYEAQQRLRHERMAGPQFAGDEILNRTASPANARNPERIVPKPHGYGFTPEQHRQEFRKQMKQVVGFGLAMATISAAGMGLGHAQQVSREAAQGHPGASISVSRPAAPVSHGLFG